MSQQLINRSLDLKRLRDEGFDVRVVKGHLLVGQVPYVNARREVKFGTLVSTLTLVADKTTVPDRHVAYFIGEHPCDENGAVLAKIQLGSGPTPLAPDLVVQHSFSAKPVSGRYPDYYEKIATYVAILSGPAKVLNPDVKAQVFPAIEADGTESVFQYEDTASSRAEIGLMTSKLELARVAIVGLGGTGAYVLDLVAKTPVKEIHIFDADKFQQHNAFRSPGAASLDEPQPMFAGQIVVVFVQRLHQDEGTSLTHAAGHLICFHGPKWLESEGYALDQGKRRVRYFECYADVDAGTVDEVWIEERTAAVRWRPFAPGTRELAAFETQLGCSLPDYHEATDEPVY